MKKVLLVAVSVVCSFFAFAQTDYVVVAKGDTLRGEVKILTYDLLDRVQLTLDNKKKSAYTAVQVRSIFFDNEIYRPQRFDNSIRFMKLVKSGYVSMYLFRAANQMSYDGRLLIKMDGKSMEVPNIGFKKLISNFVEDCPEVFTKVKNEELKRGDLDKIIDEYNACITTKSNAPTVAAPTAPVNAAPVVTNKTEAIKNLQAKVATLDNLTDKKDVLDLLADISDKASKEKAIPNYQLEALKGYLNGNEAVKTELEKVIALLKPN